MHHLWDLPVGVPAENELSIPWCQLWLCVRLCPACTNTAHCCSEIIDKIPAIGSCNYWLGATIILYNVMFIFSWFSTDPAPKPALWLICALSIARTFTLFCKQHIWSLYWSKHRANCPHIPYLIICILFVYYMALPWWVHFLQPPKACWGWLVTLNCKQVWMVVGLSCWTVMSWWLVKGEHCRLPTDSLDRLQDNHKL